MNKIRIFVSIFVIVFAIIAVTFTSAMIQITNHGDNLSETKESLSSGEIKIEDSNEKTLDLYGMYDENDLIIEESTIEISGKEIIIPEISGLKDKKVESKINQNIMQKIFNKYEELKNNKSFYLGYTSYEKANFANVISLHFYCSYEDFEEKHHFYTLGLNYELIHGEELKIEDLFKKNEDIGILARLGMYKDLAKMNNEFYYDTWYDNIHYDSDEGAWKATFYKSWYDEKTNEYKESSGETEYVPAMTDYEIEKKVRRFLRNEEREFAFTSSKLEMNVDGTNCVIYFFDMPDKVVIYDKYLTKESLFENDNIGRKNIINCSNERSTGKYKETKYESENFFYDIDAIESGWGDNDKISNFMDLKEQGEIQKLKEKLENYRKLAKANPDKAYFVLMQSTISIGGEYQSEKYEFNNLYSIERGIKVVTCSIEDRQKVLDEILSKYRYYNLGFYRTIYEYLWIPEEDINWESNSEKHLYNIYTGRELNSVADLFIPGIDYESVLKSKIDRDLGSKIEYDFDLDYIIVRSADKNNYNSKYFSMSDLEEFLVVKGMEPNILSESSVRNYQAQELETLTKEELNIAYNELFARHGHDFKTKSLKEYFSFWNWYVPIANKSVSLEELNEVEKYNANLLKEVISEKS